MKKVNLLVVGKIKEKYLADGIAEYTKRLSRFCELKIIEIPDNGDNHKCADLESAELLKHISGYTILFDIDGKIITSPELHKIIDSAYTAGNDTVSFIIGGSHGVSKDLKSRSSIAISFGRVTYPHQLMRLMALEQIYRAFNIGANTPYHK